MKENGKLGHNWQKDNIGDKIYALLRGTGQDNPQETEEPHPLLFFFPGRNNIPSACWSMGRTE
jgi:hypothetical protein